MKGLTKLIQGRVVAASFALTLFSIILLAAAKSSATSAWSSEFEGNAAFLGTGSVRRGESKFQGVSEIMSSSSLVFTRQISDSAQLRIGGEYQLYLFDTTVPTPIPGVVQGANLVLGANFNFGQAILVRIDTRPGFYGEFAHFSLKNFNVPFQIGGIYFVSANLMFIAGAEINVNRRIPVYPGAGVYWRISNKWVLNGVLPRPQLEYILSDKLMLHAGADLNGSTFRMGNDFGRDRGIKKLDNAVLDYQEVRVGGGLVWQISKNFKVDLGAGCVPYRRFDYNRANYKILSDDIVPYARIGLSAEF